MNDKDEIVDIKVSKKPRKSQVTLKYLTSKLKDEVVEKYNPYEDPKGSMIKTADFINAIKTIADLNGLKVVPDNTFKGSQDIDFG